MNVNIDSVWQNTTDPRAKQEIREGAGAVASDSLAAESARSGGGFSENRDSEPLAVKGSNSTFANTNTSSATTLNPAPSASDRDSANDSAGNTKYPETTGGQGQFPGVHNADGYYGGSTKAKQEMSSGGGSGEYNTQPGSTDKSSASTGVGTSTSSAQRGAGSSGQGDSTSTSSGNTADNPQLDPAPSYVTPVVAQPGPHTGKPHGKNLHDVTDTGFDDDTGKDINKLVDVDSQDHPSRKAVQDFQSSNASAIGTGPTQGKVTGEGVYDALNSDEQA